MNRIDRLNAILIHLQSKSRIPLAELEDRFELSRRTIFRDIRALIDAGVPIGGNAGEGYFIVEGYHLPPVVFDKNEASAILLGAKLIEHQSDSHTSMAFQNALTKVKAVLRLADKEFLDELEKKISIIPSPVIEKGGFPDSHLSEIQYAIASHRTLMIEYYSSYSDSTTTREIEPLGLVYYSNRWHVIAYCQLREDLRDFRSDRMMKLNITSNEFDPIRHPDHLEFLTQTLSGTDAKEVIIRFKKEISRFIGDQKYFHGFIEESDEGDEVEMRFYIPSYDFFARWLLAFGPNVRIVSPQALKDMVANLASEVYHHFNPSS